MSDQKPIKWEDYLGKGMSAEVEGERDDEGWVWLEYNVYVLNFQNEFVLKIINKTMNT